MGGMVSLWGASSLIKSVQRGNISLTGVDIATGTINAVVTENSVLSWLSSNNGGADPNSQLCQIRIFLTNATTITVTRQSITNNLDASYEVIEFLPCVLKSIQRGPITINNGSGTSTATITAVDPNKSLLMWLGTQVQNVSGNANDTYNRLNSTNATTITVTRSGSTNANVTAYQVLEYF
jgi:hypothetical protein